MYSRCSPSGSACLPLCWRTDRDLKPYHRARTLGRLPLPPLLTTLGKSASRRRILGESYPRFLRCCDHHCLHVPTCSSGGAIPSTSNSALLVAILKRYSLNTARAIGRGLGRTLGIHQCNESTIEQARRPIPKTTRNESELHTSLVLARIPNHQFRSNRGITPASKSAMLATAHYATLLGAIPCAASLLLGRAKPCAYTGASPIHAASVCIHFAWIRGVVGRGAMISATLGN